MKGANFNMVEHGGGLCWLCGWVSRQHVVG